jgi:hypothetical protein
MRSGVRYAGPLPAVSNPFDVDPETRVRRPSEITSFASRFSQEAVAGLVLEMRTSKGRTRIVAAQQLLQLALLNADRPPVVNLTDAELDQAICETLQDPNTERWLAQFGYVKVRSESDRRKARVLLEDDTDEDEYVIIDADGTRRVA